MRRRLFQFLFILFIILQSSSCKNKYDFRKEKSAADQIVYELQNGKIVFLGENHSDVYPCLFLKNNLQKFYNSGLRYIFFEEESDNYLYNPENTWFFIYPVWGTWAHKYETRLLYEEIKRINKNFPQDPLIAIWAEEGLSFTDEEFKDEGLILNKRDNLAQNTIISTLENTSKDKKALIFYGGAHGKKNPIPLTESSEWKMIGSYLNDLYKEQFKTFEIYSFNNNKYHTVKYNSDSDCIVTPENLENILLDGTKKEFDYYCLTPREIYGVPNVLVPDEINLKYLISFENQKKSNVEEMSVWSNKSQQLLSIYYLKYYFGDKFEYDFRCSDEQLSFAINKLRKEEITSLPYNIDELEKYIELIYSYGWLEDYLVNPDNDKRIDYILYNMNKAKKINNRDIWPQYWISYIKTEIAQYSNKKSDYNKALSCWEELLKNELLYSSPVLKLVYQKMALCENKLGDTKKQEEYLNNEKNFSTLLDFDYQNYMYFGY